MGHSLACSLVCSHRSLVCLLRTARFAHAFHYTHSFARSLTSLTPSLVGQWIIDVSKWPGFVPQCNAMVTSEVCRFSSKFALGLFFLHSRLGSPLSWFFSSGTYSQRLRSYNFSALMIFGAGKSRKCQSLSLSLLIVVNRCQSLSSLSSPSIDLIVVNVYLTMSPI